MSLSLHKGMTKHVLRDAGVPDVRLHCSGLCPGDRAVSFDPPYFVKPVAEGTGKGVSPESVVRQRENLPAVCKRLITAYGQPVLVEPFLPGREFTVAIIGTGREASSLGTMEVLLLSKAEQGIYSYVNKKLWEDRVKYELVRPDADPVVAEAEDVALNAWRVLGCRDAGPRGHPM